MAEKIKNYLLLIIQHKNFYYAISLILSSGIIYYSYTYHIKDSYEQVQSIKANIGKFKGDGLKNSIKELKQQKRELRTNYQTTLDEKNEKELLMYDKVYDVVVDVMHKLNNSSFNIYKYQLSEEYDEITLELNGSYLNLIKLFDYLQTIKANVIIEAYTIELVDDKMLIHLKLKVGILKI